MERFSSLFIANVEAPLHAADQRLAKKLENHRAAISLWIASYNLCRVHETLRCTPAMALGVTDHIGRLRNLRRRCWNQILHHRCLSQRQSASTNVRYDAPTGSAATQTDRGAWRNGNEQAVKYRASSCGLVKRRANAYILYGKPMPYKPSHVANSFLYRARQEGRSDIDALKIQKLVYFFHGYYLGKKRAAGVGELFEAWPYGPVLTSLYHKFKIYGARPIEGYATDLDPNTREYRTLMIDPADSQFSDVFDRVWNQYKDLTGLALSKLTHALGTPWRSARDHGWTYLSNDEIETYFSKSL
jgi:uncharacterized phage-associated protein